MTFCIALSLRGLQARPSVLQPLARPIGIRDERAISPSVNNLTLDLTESTTMKYPVPGIGVDPTKKRPEWQTLATLAHLGRRTDRARASTSSSKWAPRRQRSTAARKLTRTRSTPSSPAAGRMFVRRRDKMRESGIDERLPRTRPTTTSPWFRGCARNCSSRCSSRS